MNATKQEVKQERREADRPADHMYSKLVYITPEISTGHHTNTLRRCCYSACF